MNLNLCALIWFLMITFKTIFSNPLETHKIDSKRFLASSNFHNFTFQIDTSFVDNSNATITLYFKDVLVAEAVNRMTKLLKVSGTGYIPSFTTVNGCFNDQLIPAVYIQTTTSADMLLFLVLDGNPYKNATSSMVCSRDSSGRPNIGVLYGNINFLQLSFNNTNYMVKLLMTELTHLLVFSMLNFGYFPNSPSSVYAIATRQTIKGPVLQTKIITPNVVRWARIYYNCQSIDGMWLEDEGGQTTVNLFWEASLLGYEYMTATASYNAPISMFTLMLFLDSGWYDPDLTLAEFIDFGRDAGCSFLDISGCNSNPVEFCFILGINTCSRQGTYRTLCTNSIYTNGCFMNLPQGNSRCSSQPSVFQYIYDDETPSATSKCQNMTIGSVPSSACLSMSCNLNGTIRLNFSNIMYECTNPGNLISVSGNMNLVCPLYRTVCFQYGCSNQCLGNGNCLETGNCNCDYFYNNTYCNEFKNCSNINQTICSAIRPQNDMILTIPKTQFFNITLNEKMLKSVCSILLLIEVIFFKKVLN